MYGVSKVKSKSITHCFLVFVNLVGILTALRLKLSWFTFDVRSSCASSSTIEIVVCQENPDTEIEILAAISRPEFTRLDRKNERNL